VIRLSTARLILCPLTRADAADVFQIRSDPEVMKYWDWQHDADLASTASAIEAMLHEIANSEGCYWILRLRDDGRFAGLCDLSDIDANHCADIGFMLVRTFWGNGFAYEEATTCLIEYARKLNLRYLRARIHSDNRRSARLLRRVGFRQVSLIPSFEIRPGVHRNCMQFELVL
jgi:ribosomal-protein-alanine N-acetyltransferase